nr:hypothetical protein [Tanacetum cinerariifolium]
MVREWMARQAEANEHDVLPNHVGEKELKYVDGVGNGVLTKKEIKKDEMRMPKEPNKEWKLNDKEELQALRVPHKPYRHLRNTPPVTYPEEVENTLGTPIEVEPLNKTKVKEVGLNCNHNTPFSSREVPSFDGPKPQPILKSPSLDNICNNDKILSEIQLEHEKEDELVVAVVKVVRKMMVAKEIKDGLLEEIKRSLDGGLSKTLVVRVKMIRGRSSRGGLAKQGNSSMILCIAGSKIQKKRVLVVDFEFWIVFVRVRRTSKEEGCLVVSLEIF